MMRYAIIDDEPIAHGIIEDFAAALQHLEKVGNCYDAFEAIDLLQRESVDVVFLDINMPKLSGFEFLKTLSNPPKVIVTSAYREYALDGYEFDVIDYLLKPFSLERFIRAVNKISFSKPELKSNAESLAKYIFIKGDKKQHQVDVSDILFIEASGNYCKVYLENETIVTLQKISYFEAELSTAFIRIHKSFIVSKEKIKTIGGGSIHLASHKVPIGLTYKSAVKKYYDQ